MNEFPVPTMAALAQDTHATFAKNAAANAMSETRKRLLVLDVEPCDVIEQSPTVPRAARMRW
jgi:hypothetical protein